MSAPSLSWRGTPKVCDFHCGAVATGESAVDRRHGHVIARQEQVVDASCKLLLDVRHCGEHPGRPHAQRLFPAVDAVKQTLVVVGKSGARRRFPTSGAQHVLLYLIVVERDELLGAVTPDE